jgi:hypothetical protein
MALLAAAVLTLAGCDKGHDWRTVAENDPRLEAAKQQARDEYPAFVKALKNPKSMTLYTADVVYEADGKSEFLSLDVQKATDADVTGSVIGYPTTVDLHQGDLVTVPAANVIDWKIETPEGDTQGGYVENERVKLQRGG